VLQGQLDNGIPWPVCTAIAEGLRQQTRHGACDIVATAALELAVSHYLGFGVEHDVEKVLFYMRTAAENSSTAAVIIVGQLHSAFGHALEFNVNAQILREDDQFARVSIAAARQLEYIMPLRELNMVVGIFDPDEMSNSLHEAAYLGHIDAMRCHFQVINVDEIDGFPRTPLFRACQGGQLGAVKFLLSCGADASLADEDGCMPLHMLIMFPEQDIDEAACCLIASSANININALADIFDVPELWGELCGTPLDWAVGAVNTAAVKALL
jgi:hypothetical protein